MSATKVEPGSEADYHEIHGHEVLEKEARPQSGVGRVYLPKEWVGETVKIVRVTKDKE